MSAPSIATRSSWGARHPNGDLALSGLATEVFIHHTVSALLGANATVAAEREQMRLLERVGQNRFGTGISYNAIIFPSGRAYQGVSWNRRGTHTGGRNSTSRGIAFAGNFETATPTAAAILTARRIVAHGRGRWWTNGAPVRGHRAVSATACPGRNVQSRLAEIASAPPAANPTPPPAANLRVPVTGRFDAATTRWLQGFESTPRDGFVSGQPANLRGANPGLTSFRWVAAPFPGSQLIVAMQRRLGGGLARDGLFGPISQRRMQTVQGTAVTGNTSSPSQWVTAMQNRINRTGRWMP